MSFPRYPAYKHSGINWIGEIPDHWSAIPLARVASQPGTLFIDGDWIESKDLADEGIRYITTGNIGQGKYKEQGSGYVSHETFKELQCTEVLPGDVLISRLNLPIGRACVVPDLGERIITSVDNVITRPDNKHLPSYLAYMLSSASHFANMEVLARGTTMQRISRSVLGHVRFALPDLEEQQVIASFLDRETAKIDALIAEQQRLIELLQEKRQAVISHAVTKGLNPDAPMKDSGVEWLGEVPEHWEVQKVKHLCRHIEQGWSPQCENEASEGDAPGVLKVGCVNGGIFRPGENKRLPPDLNPIPEYSVRQGDLLISRANTKELVGSAAVVTEDYPWLFICDKLYRITINPSLTSASFLASYLGSSEVRGQVELGASGASQSMQNISQSVLMELPIALPDLNEQEAIRNAIANECCSIDELVAEGGRGIQLLQERRSALISAAVTGQIDVRGLVPEASAA